MGVNSIATNRELCSFLMKSFPFALLTFIPKIFHRLTVERLGHISSILPDSCIYQPRVAYMPKTCKNFCNVRTTFRAASNYIPHLHADMTNDKPSSWKMYINSYVAPSFRVQTVNSIWIVPRGLC